MMRATPYWSVSPMRDQRIHATENEPGEQDVDGEHAAPATMTPSGSAHCAFHAGFGNTGWRAPGRFVGAMP